RLVGGDHVLAGGDGFHHQLAGDAVAADQLDDDVDVGIGDDLAGVLDDLGGAADDGFRAGGVEVRHHGDFDAAAGAALDLGLVALEDVVDTAAYGAYAQQ